MPVFQKNKSKLLFIHIPKTAGFSIEQTLVREGYEMTYHAKGEAHRRFACSDQHMHKELFESEFSNIEFDHIFTVVRCPINRLVSEFNGLVSFSRNTLKISMHLIII